MRANSRLRWRPPARNFLTRPPTGRYFLPALPSDASQSISRDVPVARAKSFRFSRLCPKGSRRLSFTARIGRAISLLFTRIQRGGWRGLHCAHRAIIMSVQARSLSLQGWGLIDLPLRATFSPSPPTGTPRRAISPCGGLRRPRVARAKKIISLHPLLTLLLDQIGKTICRAENIAGCGYTMLHARISMALTCGTTGKHFRRMFKKAIQQGRRRVETGGVPSGVR